jgi:acetolactate synthase-1/2/3 large subunit
MAASALWTAAHYRVPMLMVVNDNRSFFNDEAHQRRLATARARPLENSTIGVRIEDPPLDFVGMARSYGCWATGPVADPTQLPAAFQAAIEVARAGGPALVHVLTAPAEY